MLDNLKFIISILIPLVIFGYVGFLIYFKKWDRLRTDAYKLMLKAEMVITGTKRGKERFEYVFNKVYSLIPWWLQFLYPPRELKEKLQEWFNIAKDGLDDGKFNGSINT